MTIHLGDGPSIRLAKPDVGEEEIEAIGRVLRGHILTNGPETEAFEQEFADYHEAGHGVALANGTVALTAMYAALGIGPGDEVIVPSLTFVSSATSVLLVGARPVFAEVDPEMFNLDPADVIRKVTARTKAILAVHYGGQPADLSELRAIADSSGIPLLEDAAEAHGARYQGRSVGAIGLAGMFSFTPTKNITTGEGGMIVTDDAALAEKLRLLRNHGQTALYQHDLLGNNWRMTEMQAAMGRVQLRKLGAILSRKREVAASLDRGLTKIPGVRPPVVGEQREHVYMLYTVRFDGGLRARNEVAKLSGERGIETRVYFPPAHRQPIFSGHRAELPVTDDIAGRILSLPVHSKLTAEEVDRIVATVAEALECVAGAAT